MRVIPAVRGPSRRMISIMNLDHEATKPADGDNRIDDPIRVYLVADQQDSPAQPQRGNRGRQADRAQPQAFPPRRVGQRLCPASRGRLAGESLPGLAAAGSHRGSVGEATGAKSGGSWACSGRIWPRCGSCSAAIRRTSGSLRARRSRGQAQQGVAHVGSTAGQGGPPGRRGRSAHPAASALAGATCSRSPPACSASPSSFAIRSTAPFPSRRTSFARNCASS